MSLRVLAELDLATVTALLDELLPVTIELDDDPKTNRSLEIAKSQLIELVAGVGLRLRTSAKVMWQIAGVKVPITISSITVLLKLAIETSPIQRIVLAPRIEDADLKNVPAIIERTLVDKINERLAKQSIGWNFGQTLALRLGMPPAMKPPMKFTLDPVNPTLDITVDKISIGLMLPMHITR